MPLTKKKWQRDGNITRRSVDWKQLGDGIGDTLVSVDAPILP